MEAIDLTMLKAENAFNFIEDNISLISKVIELGETGSVVGVKSSGGCVILTLDTEREDGLYAEMVLDHFRLDALGNDTLMYLEAEGLPLDTAVLRPEFHYLSAGDLPGT